MPDRKIIASINGLTVTVHIDPNEFSLSQRQVEHLMDSFARQCATVMDVEQGESSVPQLPAKVMTESA